MLFSETWCYSSDRPYEKSCLLLSTFDLQEAGNYAALGNCFGFISLGGPLQSLSAVHNVNAD